MMYQRISLATSEPVGNPGPLPFAVAGWPAELVLDLSALDPGYELTDAGFWPVVDDIPVFEPTTHRAVPGEITQDIPQQRFVRAWSTERLPLPDLTMRQFRLGLLNANLLTAVEAAIDALTEPDRSAARIEFEYASVVVRTDPWVTALALPLGLTDQQIDDLWTWAAGL